MLKGCQRSKSSLNWPPILYNNINTNEKRKKWYKGVTSHLQNKANIIKQHDTYSAVQLLAKYVVNIF